MTLHKHLNLTAMVILVALCASWGMQQVAVKVAIPGVSPVAQSGIRSIGATALILMWMLLGEPITPMLLIALLLVGSGIYLVNRPQSSP